MEHLSFLQLIDIILLYVIIMAVPLFIKCDQSRVATSKGYRGREERREGERGIEEEK